LAGSSEERPRPFRGPDLARRDRPETAPHVDVRTSGRQASYDASVLSSGVESVAEDLRRYGENATARWVLTCSDDEFVRVCSVAEWLLYYGPSTASGRSMMIAKACALAAVYVHEGAPRDLSRSRRTEPTGVLVPPDGGRRPNYSLQVAMARDYGVGEDVRAFWRSPG
jgi:hypothetical protein